MLAPLQGVTDAILRDLMTSMGGIDACVSVYSRVSVCALPARALARRCPEAARGARTPSGTAVHLQLLGGDPELVAKTACNAAQLGARVVDLNFGCPMGRVNRNEGGAALLRDLGRLERIVDAVRRSTPDWVEVSAKVRTGWSNASEVADIVKAVERGGASWVTVHGRTRAQLYDGSADWEAIGAARRAVTIPVVANGDIRSVEDLARCVKETGCSFFMIGRGALAKPELFRQLSGIEAEAWCADRRLRLLVTYGDRCVDAGFSRGSVVGKIKGWWRYMALGDTEVAARFERARRLTKWDDVRSLLIDG